MGEISLHQHDVAGDRVLERRPDRCHLHLRSHQHLRVPDTDRRVVYARIAATSLRDNSRVALVRLARPTPLPAGASGNSRWTPRSLIELMQYYPSPINSDKTT